MEFIIAPVIIIVILVLLGVPFSTIAFGIWVVLLSLSALSELFFAFSFLLLLFTKRKPATLLRLEKGKKAGLFAVYEIDEKEHRNTFPTDAVLENKLYAKHISQKDGVNVQVLRLFSRYLVFDNVTLLVIFLGLPAFLIMTVAMLAGVL